MRSLIVAFLLLLASSALAQQPRPMTLPEMQGAALALQAQVDFLRVMHAQSEAKASGLQDELLKALARIKELESKDEKK
jgi:hypothetical protein